MATFSGSQSTDDVFNLSIGLDTIPSEIRAIIYKHICNPICLEVDSNGKLIMTAYPWQLSAVSHLIRAEISPILLGKSTLQPLHLLCAQGRFPHNIRQRIPNRVLYGISTITILGALKFDDLKPSLTTFPNLCELRWHGLTTYTSTSFNELWYSSHARPLLSDEIVTQLIQNTKKFTVLPATADLKRQQEMPREGLERDYYVDGTLHEVLTTSEKRRGFEVKMLLNLYSRGYRFIGNLEIESWDAEKGRLIPRPDPF